MNSNAVDTVDLGKTGIKVPEMGIGAWQWGDRIIWGFGRGYSSEDARGAFVTSINAGLTFIDTAEIYGSGTSEKLLGNFLHSEEIPGGIKGLIIATKFFPFPWRIWEGALIGALQKSLKRLKLDQVDLYQIHNPMTTVPVETMAKWLARAVEEKLTRAVGVSNYNFNQTGKTFNVLAERGVPLASNQVEYSLLNRKIEKNGLFELCQGLGVTIIAYSPLAKGVLTGKYSPENPPPGIRGRMYGKEYLQKVQPLIGLMREIGGGHGSKSPAQVALNWLICKGTLPIPGAKNARQAQENARAAGWRLTSDEVAALDAESDKL